jgi:signal transduction histidine kinase
MKTPGQPPPASIAGIDEQPTSIADVLRADRERIGMELHDGVIQSLYALGLGLEGVIQTLESDVPLARTRLIQARDTINNVMLEIRAYIVGLRSEARPVPTLATRFADVARELSLNLAVDVSSDVEKSLLAAERQQLYLIGREALVNVAKHARATQVTLSLGPVPGPSVPGAWTMWIRDNGIGIGPHPISPTSFGLTTMRKRARMLGATFRLSSRPGEGTRIRLSHAGSRLNPLPSGRALHTHRPEGQA